MLMRRLLMLGGLAGLVLGWNMPNHYPLWTSFHGELAAAVGAVLFFGGVAWPQPHSAQTLRLSKAEQAWIAVALIAPLQFILGRLEFRGDAALGLLYPLGVALALYAGRLAAAQSGLAATMRALWITLVVAALLALAFALAQWLQLPPKGWWAMELIDSRPFANFAQPNHFGLAMLLGIVATTALFESGAIRHRATLALAYAALGWGLLISQSRAALLAVWVLALLWFATRRRAPTRLAIADVVAALVAGTALYFALPAIEAGLLLRAAELRSPVEIGPRALIWRHFLAAIAAHPWLGYGFGQGVAALAEVATQVEPSRNTIYAHSVVLDLMTWFGVPLALLLVGAFALWMSSWLRGAGGGAQAVAQRHLVFAAWLALVVESLLEYPFAHAYFVLPLALLAGAVAPAAATGTRPSRPALAAAFFATALLATLATEYLRLEDDFRAGRFARYNFADRPQHEMLERPLLLDQLAALNASIQTEPRRGMTPEQIEQLHRLARRFHLLPTRMDYAKALWLNGRAADAENELRIIRGVYPPSQFARIEREWNAWKEEHRDEPRLPEGKAQMPRTRTPQMPASAPHAFPLRPLPAADSASQR